MFLPAMRIGFFQEITLPAAPVVGTADMQTFTAAEATKDYLTSGLTIGSGRAFVISGTNSSATLSSLAGADDTSSAVAANTSTPKIYAREMTIVSSLDATWTLTMSASCRAGILGMVVTGISSIPTPANKAGTGATLPNTDSFLVTGGPRNILVVDAMAILGSHATNPPVSPSGFTLLDTVGAVGSDAPTDNNRPTVAVAQRTYAAGDLTWTGDEATIPAATWGGLADIGTQAWSTVRLVLLS